MSIHIEEHMMDIIYEPSLAARTTLRLGGKAIAELRISESDDFELLETTLQKLGGTMYVLGAGSNILASDGELPFVLVRPRCMTAPYRVDASQIRVVDGDSAAAVHVRVGAGIRLPRLLGACTKWGLSGLEGLCGIPGTVGGAVAMNAGSFGDTIGDTLHSVEIYTKSTGIIEIEKSRLQCAYRKFSICDVTESFFVLHATFSLTPAPMNGIKKRLSHNFFKKKSTQPVKAWSAGCVFKNPPNGFAGMLLEKCAFKGRRKGGMFFSPLHANFLINDGSGSAAAAFDLLDEAREAVQQRFDVRLESEVKILHAF